MPGINDTLEQIRDSLGDLPERLLKAMATEKAQTPPKVLPKLKEAETDDRNFVNTPISEWFQQPPEALPVDEDDPRLEQFQPSKAKQQEEEENDRLYEEAFGPDHRVGQNRPPNVLPADEPEGRGPHSLPSSSTETAEAQADFSTPGVEELPSSVPSGGGGEAVDLAEIVGLLERIATGIEAMNKGGEPAKATGESSGPTKWREPPETTPSLSVRSKQTGRSLL